MDAWINEPLSSESSSEDEDTGTQLFPKYENFSGEYNVYSGKKKPPEPTEEELAKV